MSTRDIKPDGSADGWLACERCGALVSVEAQHRLGWALCASCRGEAPGGDPPREGVAAHLERATAAIARYDWARARSELEGALRASPFHPRAMRMLGLVNLHRGQHAVAWTIWEQSQRLHPDAEGLLYLGLYFWSTGHPERAAHHWRRAATLDPGLPTALAEGRAGRAAFAAFPSARVACEAVVRHRP